MGSGRGFRQGKDGSESYVWGEGVQGLAIYTSGGRFSTQTISANRDKAASKNPRMPAGQSIGYFGTCADEQNVAGAGDQLIGVDAGRIKGIAH